MTRASSLWLVAAVLAAFGADQSQSGDFTLTLADGKTVTGSLEELGDQWSVRLGGATPVQAAGADVLTLRRSQTLRPAFPAGEQIVFANGDRLAGKVLKLSGERLRFRADLSRDYELLLPLSALSVLWITAPDEEDQPAAFLRQLATGRRRQDLVLLRNGDVLEGLLTALDSQTRLRIEVAKKEVAVDFPQVAAVAFNTDLVRSLRPKDTYARLVLANGCRLALASARADKVALTGKTLFGAEVTVPVAQINALDLFQGGAVYLSDLKPRRYEFTPFLGSLRLPYVVNGSVRVGSTAGGDLSLGGSTYDKGLGMHSASRLTYDLGGGYRRFEALVGLDDRTERTGSARVRVLVDGQPRDLGWDGELTGKNGPKAVRVGVAAGRELTLVVDFGRLGDVQGRVNWVDARLCK
jgi:hypothetical protein